MTAGGTCYHCGQPVSCLPDFAAEFVGAPVHRGRWDAATRRWSCFTCVPEAVAPSPVPAVAFVPDLEHQRRELPLLRLRPSKGAAAAAAASEKLRGQLAEMKALRRASQPWRRR